MLKKMPKAKLKICSWIKIETAKSSCKNTKWFLLYLSLWFKKLIKIVYEVLKILVGVNFTLKPKNMKGKLSLGFKF